MPVYEREVAHNWNWLTLCRREPGKALWRCCRRWILKDKFYKQTKVDQGKRKDIAETDILKSTVQFSRLVVSDSLRPHGLQHTRPPCPSPTPGVHANPCPLSWWCHPTISSSVDPFSSCLQSFLASGSSNESALQIRWQKYWSFSFNISPCNEHSGLILWMNWFGFPCSPRDSQESSPTP